VSLQDIQQNPQDVSNFYLANMYQATIADQNRSNISSPLPASPPPFSPPTYAVWVNSLWFLSLVISVTCALFATLLQQWARRYLKVTQTGSSLHKRARVRSFFAEGVKKSHLSMVVEALPTLIHVSLFLFFAGLAVFLWNVNLTIFKVVLSWIGICTASYGCVTLIPIFNRNSPYHSPLTALARPVIQVVLLLVVLLYLFSFFFLVYLFSFCFGCGGPIRISGRPLNWLLQVGQRIKITPVKAALKLSSEIDTRAFMWTFDSLDEDDELERFFSGLPGFHNSKVLKKPLVSLDDQQKLRILEAVIRLLDRTFSSNLLPDQVKCRRADICAKAIDLVDTPEAFPGIIRSLASEGQYGPAETTEIVDFVRRWDRRKGEDSTLVQAMLSIVVARVQRRDDSWFKLASDELNIPETVLREYATHGDNLSLAMLIYVARQQFIHIRNPLWPSKAISDVLRAASKFNAQDTSPELQHEFCALWNQMVRDAQIGTSNISEDALGPIRNPYIALHQGTNSAPTRFSPSTGDDDPVLFIDGTFPLCHATDHVHNGSASTTSPHIDPHDDAAPSPASLTSPVAPSFPLPAPFYVDESVMTVPPLDISHPARQIIEHVRVPVTFPDQATAGGMRDTVTLGIMTPLPTPEASTSSPDLLSTFQPAPVPPQHCSNPLAPSRPPNFPSSASSNPSLHQILHTGPSLLLMTLRLTSDVLIVRNSYRCSQRFSRGDLCD
jgi:hypothetical protein